MAEQMTWKCRHCGHEAASEESCCWENWAERAGEKEDLALSIAIASAAVALLVVAVWMFAVTYRAGALW